MSAKILVAYASRTGTTAGVAEVIGQVFAEDGTAVDVQPVGAVRDLSPYSAVVAGSAIRGAEWLPEAMQFVRDHQRELAARPFAAFLVCMTLAMTNRDYHEEVARWLQPVCDLVEPSGRSQPTVSHHLALLVEAGLLTRDKRGRWAWYAVVPERLAALQQVLTP